MNKPLYKRQIHNALDFVVNDFLHANLRDPITLSRTKERLTYWFYNIDDTVNVWAAGSRIPEVRDSDLTALSQAGLVSLLKRLQKDVRNVVGEQVEGVGVRGVKIRNIRVYSISLGKTAFGRGISGSFRDVFLYGLDQILGPNMDRIIRCPEEKCGHKIFYRSEVRGRPREYCSDACANRAYQRKYQKQLWEDLKKFKQNQPAAYRQKQKSKEVNEK